MLDLNMIHAIGGYALLLTCIICAYKLARKWQDMEW